MDPGVILSCRMHETFPDRLAEARALRNLPSKTLAAIAGIGHDVARALEARPRPPRLRTVERLAKALGVNPCWLAYGTLPMDAPGKVDLAGFCKRLESARLARGLSRSALARMAGCATSGVGCLERGATAPTIAKAERLALALRVKAGWLAFGIRAPASNVDA